MYIYIKDLALITHEGWYAIKQRNKTKPYPLSYRLNSTTTVLLQGWLWHLFKTHKSWYAIKQRNKTKPYPTQLWSNFNESFRDYSLIRFFNDISLKKNLQNFFRPVTSSTLNLWKIQVLLFIVLIVFFFLVISFFFQT